MNFCHRGTKTDWRQNLLLYCSRTLKLSSVKQCHRHRSSFRF